MKKYWDHEIFVINPNPTAKQQQQTTQLGWWLNMKMTLHPTPPPHKLYFQPGTIQCNVNQCHLKQPLYTILGTILAVGVLLPMRCSIHLALRPCSRIHLDFPRFFRCRSEFCPCSGLFSRSSLLGLCYVLLLRR